MSYEEFVDEVLLMDDEGKLAVLAVFMTMERMRSPSAYLLEVILNKAYKAEMMVERSVEVGA